MIKLKIIDIQNMGDEDMFILIDENDTEKKQYLLPFNDKLVQFLRVRRKNRKEEVLTPRDIQHMLRSGKDSKSIAAEYCTSYDWIQKFEPPILAERSFIAYRARSMQIFRNSGESTNLTLNEIFMASLVKKATRNMNCKPTWDAVHLSGSTWLVSAVLERKSEQEAQTEIATWSFNTKTVKVVPHNKHAQNIMSDYNTSSETEYSELKEKHNLEKRERDKLKFFNNNKQKYLLNKQKNLDEKLNVPEWDEVLFGDYL
jgi:hypothetical protein